MTGAEDCTSDTLNIGFILDRRTSGYWADVYGIELNRSGSNRIGIISL
jgi:hypothetical protein